jgi:hypothetical protein
MSLKGPGASAVKKKHLPIAALLIHCVFRQNKKIEKKGHSLRFFSFWSYFVEKKILRCLICFIFPKNEI